MVMEGGDFNDFWFEYYMCQVEMLFNQMVVVEQFVYLIWCGVGGNVKIFWFFVKQQVVDVVVDQSGFVVCFVEVVYDFEGVFIDIFVGNSMLFMWDYCYRCWFDGGFCFVFFMVQYFMVKISDLGKNGVFCSVRWILD